MSESHITLQHLIARGWTIVSNERFTHSDGSRLERDRNDGRWYLHTARKQRYVGSTLRVAIETVTRGVKELAK